MGAGTPPTTTNGTPTKMRWWIIVSGTAAVVAVGGVASQFWRPQPGVAAEEPAGKASLNNAQKKTTAERKVAKVGKESITEDVLARECVARFGKEVLEDLINRVVIQQACEAEGVTITQTEVEQEIVKIAKKYNLDPVDWQKMLQAERGITPEQYRMSVIFPMLALRKLAAAPAQDELTEEDLQKEFERQYGERAKVRMIMLDNLRRANECWTKCKRDPESFDKLAQEYSIEPNSRSLGGTIPPIPRHSGNETIEKEAFKLESGEISGLIEVDRGNYVILKSEGKTQPVIDKLDEVRDQLVDELKERKVQENIAKVFAKIKEKTPVHNLLTGAMSGPDLQSVNPAARGGAPGAQKPTGIQQTSGEQPAPKAATKPKTSAAAAPNRK